MADKQPVGDVSPAFTFGNAWFGITADGQLWRRNAQNTVWEDTGQNVAPKEK